MNRSLPYSYLFIILLLLLGPLAQNVSAHDSEAPNEIIIHIDENGYEPNRVTIEQGTRVIFENAGKENQWPASDSHPSHTLYSDTSIDEHCAPDSSPTFDSCGPIKPDQSWVFVFDKIGTHKYHDHLWPHLTGEIIVDRISKPTLIEGGTSIKSIEEEPKKSNLPQRFFNFFRNLFSKIFSIFVPAKSDAFIENEIIEESEFKKEFPLKKGVSKTEFYETLTHKYEDIVIHSNPREAITTLQDDSTNNDDVLALCHDILHEIGHVAFEKYGSFKEAVQYQSDFCNSGYIHGLFESYFEKEKNPLEGLSEQCLEYASGKRPFDLWQCYHGIGHGFMYLTGGDLDKSLDLCEENLEQEAIGSCQNGAYMEVFNLEILAKENSFVDPEDPFLTCSTRTDAKGDCYLYMPTYLSQTIGMEYSDIFDECNKTEFGYRNNCIGGIGSEAMKRNMNNTDEVFALCEKASSIVDQKTCIMGAISIYMNQEGSHTSGERLCKAIPKQHKNTCDEIVSNKELFFK